MDGFNMPLGTTASGPRFCNPWPPEGAVCGACAHYEGPEEWNTGTALDMGLCCLASGVRKLPGGGREVEPEWAFAADNACEDWSER